MLIPISQWFLENFISWFHYLWVSMTRSFRTRWSSEYNSTISNFFFILLKPWKNWIIGAHLFLTTFFLIWKKKNVDMTIIFIFLYFLQTWFDFFTLSMSFRINSLSKKYALCGEGWKNSDSRIRKNRGLFERHKTSDVSRKSKFRTNGPINLFFSLTWRFVDAV